MIIEIHKLTDNAVIPKYAKEGDAGADLVSIEDVTLHPKQRILVATGLSMAIPMGYVGLIHPRSGLAFNKGLTVLNSPGTIDAGYRGEVKVLLINHSQYEPVTIQKGERIAQLIIQKVEFADFKEVDALSETERGEGGFGSTGLTSEQIKVGWRDGEFEGY